MDQANYIIILVGNFELQIKLTSNVSMQKYC